MLAPEDWSQPWAACSKICGARVGVESAAAEREVVGLAVELEVVMAVVGWAVA